MCTILRTLLLKLGNTSKRKRRKWQLLFNV